MIFQRISYRIALQFTAFVFLLFLVNGSIFLAADLRNARRQTESRLTRTAQLVLDQLVQGVPITVALPPILHERVRVTDALGTPLFVGALLRDVPFTDREGLSTARIQREEYTVLTRSLLRAGQRVGFIQVAEIERFQLGDLPLRAMLYLLVSVGISALTFMVGVFFAKRSLRPAEQMMTRLEQFTQDASHELRTPLATLHSSLDLALHTEKYKEGILSAKDDLQEISSLVERLLELARLDKSLVQSVPVDLSGLIREVIERQRALAQERGVTIESTLKEGVTVRGDAGLLRQVIVNILSNAIKFSKQDGGTVTVNLDKRALRIADQGIGIPGEMLPRIFDRFFQADTSRANEGLGLGLALVKRIVELHGWTIRAQSRLGEGTRFTIIFGSVSRKNIS